jgi:hypothetical protein
MAQNRRRVGAEARERGPDAGRRARRPRRRYSRRVRTRRRLVVVLAIGLIGVGVAYASRSGGAPAAPPAQATVAAGDRAPRARTAAAPHVVVTAPRAPTPGWTVVAEVRGHPAAWVAQRSAVTFLRFDQSLVHLTLHAGSSDGGVAGWTYGDQISPREIHLVLAAFNGGFRLTYTDVGFSSGGHVAVALKPGLASIVTYTDGTSNIGTWLNGVPTARKTVFSVLQNQRLLVDRGAPAATVTSCVLACWGHTIQALTSVARSGLGITSSGQLVWAAGEQLSPAGLAAALISAGAVRAIELDINPDWVAGYLYVHHATGPAAVPVIPGQHGIGGQLLAPYSRDFIAVVAN